MIEYINKIMRYPERLPCDKRIHFIGGSVVGSILMSILILTTTADVTILIGGYLVLVMGIAWGIELYQDLTKSGQYDNIDALAVLIGSITAILPYAVSGL